MSSVLFKPLLWLTETENTHTFTKHTLLLGSKNAGIIFWCGFKTDEITKHIYTIHLNTVEGIWTLDIS